MLARVVTAEKICVPRVKIRKNHQRLAALLTCAEIITLTTPNLTLYGSTDELRPIPVAVGITSGLHQLINSRYDLALNGND